MEELRVLSPTGMLGSGFRTESLQRALEWDPHFIGCDAGSTDAGPYYLGSGEIQFSEKALRRDLEHLLAAARARRIPLLVGSAGTGGADPHLEQVVDIVTQAARAQDLHFRLGVIRCEPPRDYLKQKYRDGKIRPLPNAPKLDEALFDRSAHIVAMAGVEPFQAALDMGADVVVSGRSSDTSIFSAIPVREGFPPGVVWHAAKILECGAASVTHRKYPDPMFAWIRQDHFVVEPPNPEYRCTPVSVASHNLYENGSPDELYEPSGVLLTDHARYEAVSDRAVRVSGSRFERAERPTVKLEGAELAGYQSVILGAVRDPIIIRQLDSWLEGMQVALRQRFQNTFGADVTSKHRLQIRRYGIDGAMGRIEPDRHPGHEVGVVMEVTADSMELAAALAKSAAHFAIHYPVPEWHGLITSLAFPYSPPELTRGPVYRFNLNHLLEPATALEPFRIETVTV